MTITRRGAMLGAAAAGAALGLGRGAFAQGATPAMQKLAAAAAGKPPVIWTESSPDDQMARVIAAFNKQFPDIRVQFVRNTGGNTLAARVVQETQGGTTPASLLTGDHQQFEILKQRNLVLERDWSELGVGAGLAPKPYLVATTAALGVLLWNKNRVSDADAPKTYQDFANPKWAGKAGTWLRAPILSNLAAVEGEEKVRAFVRGIVANRTRMYDSTFQLAQEVGSGEVEVGFGLYHSTMPPIAQGAPIAIAFTDPVPLSTIFSCVVSRGGNPEGAQVLAAWLATPQGADAYEAATGRGNPAVPGSKASELVKGRKLSEWSIDDTPTYVKLLTEFNKMLSDARGK